MDEAPAPWEDLPEVPACARRAEVWVTSAAVRRRAGLLALLPVLLWAGSCATAGGVAGAPRHAPRVLPSEEGASVAGRVAPGEALLYSLTLEKGQYFEVHLLGARDAAEAHLFEPGVEPQATGGNAYTWTEPAPEVHGQVLWEVADASGVHRLRVRATSEEPVDFRLLIAILRPATARDWSRHTCLIALNEANRFSKSWRLEEALVRYQESMELCEGGGYVRGMASSASGLARVLQHLDRREEARAMFLRAVELWKEVGETASVAGALVGLAGLEREAARWTLAERHLEEALPLARQAGNRVVEANAIDQYCRLYLLRGETEVAIGTCRHSVELWESLGKPAEAVDSLTNLGTLHFRKGELDAALAYDRQALGILEQHPNREQEATVRNDLARLHEAAGEYQTALAYFQEALEGYEAIGRTPYAAQVLHNMGTIHHDLGNLDTALSYLQQALTRMEDADDTLGRIRALHGLSAVHQARGDLDRARSILERALELSRGAGSPVLLADSLGRTGALRMAEDRPEEALAPLEEALELCRESRDRWREADLLADLARAVARTGRIEGALDLLYEAAALNEDIGRRSGLADAHYEIARIERARGNLDRARDSIEQALALVDSFRPLIGADELRALYSATVRPYRDLYIDLLMEQHARRPDGGHDAEALQESERGRAQSLLDILAEAELEPGSEVSESLLAERASLQHRLNVKELERQNALAEEEPDSASLIRIKFDIEGFLTRLREVERRIRAESPRYAALTRPQAVSRGEIQRSILDPETTLLEYSLGEEGSFLWVVTDDDFRTYELPGRDEIEEMARCLHWLITAYGEPPPAEALAPYEATCLGDRFAAFEGDPGRGPFQLRRHRRTLISQAYSEQAPELSRALLAGPARDGLLRYRLAVVSDGALEYVPFAALPEPLGNGRLLVTVHELVRLPSASVLAYQRERLEPAEEPSGELAIVADPLYGLDDPRIEKSARSRNAVESTDEPGSRGGLLASYRRLDFAGREAEAIARFAAAGDTFIARGADASRETVLGGALSGYRYVHFATHGEIDTQHPELSGLVLSLVDATGTRIQDGFLRLHEIYGMELDDSDMVVLSACDTALGREIRGEGLVGLTRGFLYAGAERVVASLWQVQDLVTAQLMEHLYRGLLEEGRPPAEALRHAQLAILEADDGRYGFPYYWAGFVLQGEWR